MTNNEKGVSSGLVPRMLTGLAPVGEETLGSNGHFTVYPSDIDAPILPYTSAILDAIHEPFTVSGFAVPREPVSLGFTELDGVEDNTAVSDMAIKFPGSGYIVPAELVAVKGFIQRCINTEMKINPQVDNYFAYLTLQRAMVHKGQYKRGRGAHSDSIQGPRIVPKTAIEHGYVVASHDPTRFYTHGFSLDGLDPNIDWLNGAITSQADPARSMQLNPYEIALFDAYTIHEASPAKVTVMRTFARLIFSVRKFDRLGNTRNTAFSYSGWEFQPRPVPSVLRGGPLQK